MRLKTRQAILLSLNPLCVILSALRLFRLVSHLNLMTEKALRETGRNDEDRSLAQLA
jgi:hypothetical protein